MSRWLIAGSVFAFVLVATATANAQDAPADGAEFVEDPNTPGVVYRKKTEYDFEDDVVEGSFVRPEGEYLDARRSARHSSLIRIRENFVPEMLKSAEDI
jgi:hypothetical protein